MLRQLFLRSHDKCVTLGVFRFHVITERKLYDMKVLNSLPLRKIRSQQKNFILLTCYWQYEEKSCICICVSIKCRIRINFIYDTSGKKGVLVFSHRPKLARELNKNFKIIHILSVFFLDNNKTLRRRIEMP